MDFKTAATLLVTVLVAMIGFSYTLHLARRKDRLRRISRQLSEYYGPLYSLCKSGEFVWRSFRETHRPGSGSYWKATTTPVSEADAHAFRTWMSAVFMPMNRAMKEIVVRRADLLEDTEMPPCLLQLCAHVSAYEALERQWEEHNFYEHRPNVNFPRKALTEYAEREYSRLKVEQAKLLRTNPSSFKTILGGRFS
jgi:hypothetical protein